MNITPETKIRLLENIPFSNYKHVRLFNSSAEQQQYFNDFVMLESDNYKYQRQNQNTIRIGVQADEILNVNYMMFQNTKYSNKWFYAFITSINYVNAGTTEITYEIDVMQTWMFEGAFNLRKVHVEREHQKRFTNNIPEINTVDEGLDYGTDYERAGQQQLWQVQGVIWIVIVSSVDLTIPSVLTYGGRTVGGVTSPLYYYVIPINTLGLPVSVNGSSPSPLPQMLNKIFTSPNLVGKVVSIYYTEFLPFNVTGTSQGIYSSDLSITGVSGINLCEVIGFTMYKKDLDCGDKYAPIRANYNYSESKLYMYPYSLAQITDFKGNEYTIKLEYINNTNLILQIHSSIAPTPKWGAFVRYYTEMLRNAGIINTDPNDVPIIDDYTASYIQGNKNQVTQQETNTQDNVARGIFQNNAMNSMFNAQMDMKQGKNDQFGQNFLYDAYMGIRQIGNAFKLEGQEWQRANTNMQNRFNNENLGISAQQEIAMQQAKIHDINNMSPTVRKLGGNPSFSFGNDYYGFFVIWKTIKPEYASKLKNYFYQFGYRINDFKIPNLKSRQHFNYIKTINCELNGSIPQSHINIIKSVFDNGVTIWHTNDMFNYNLANNEV